MSGLVLDFGPDASLTIEGDLTASGVTFTSSDAVNGWASGGGGAIRFEPGSSGALTDVTIENVGGYGNEAVRIHNASPTLTRATLLDTPSGRAVSGIRVTGANAAPIIDDSEFRNLSVDGIVVTDQASARLMGNTVADVGGDALVVGYDAKVYVSPRPGSAEGNLFEINGGHGVYATLVGEVIMGYNEYPTPTDAFEGRNSMVENAGRGVFALHGAYVGAGNAAVNQENRFVRNTTEDARAKGSGTVVYARCNWWDQVAPPFATSALNGAVLDDSFWLNGDPANPNPPTPVECMTGGGSARGAASGGGTVKTGERSAADRLAQAAVDQHRDPALALADLARVADDSPTHAAAALAEVARVALREASGPAAQAAAVALLTSRLARPDPVQRAAAQRGLLRARHRAGDLAGALEMADALAASDEGRVLGLAARAYVLRDMGRDTEARAAADALDAAAPGSREAALVRRDVTGEAPRGRADAAATPEALSAAVAERTTAGAVSDEGLSPVLPNPSTGAARTTLVLGAPAEVRVAVYDVLGREVAVLAEGAREAGRHAVEVPASGWAPGLYVVRARVAGPGGGARIYSRRFTLASR